MHLVAAVNLATLTVLLALTTACHGWHDARSAALVVLKSDGTGSGGFSCFGKSADFGAELPEDEGPPREMSSFHPLDACSSLEDGETVTGALLTPNGSKCQASAPSAERPRGSKGHRGICLVVVKQSEFEFERLTPGVSW